LFFRRRKIMKDKIAELNNLMPGQSVVYFTGHLGMSSSDPEVKQLRDTAYMMHVEDRVMLTQRVVRRNEHVYVRHTTSIFEYVATAKRLPPNPRVVMRRRAYLDDIRKGGK
jgi:hypothetical protein